MENQSIRFGALPPAVQNAILQSQQDEENGAQVYAYMARHEKDPHNRDILLHMSQDEKSHAEYWRSFSQKDIKPNRLRILWLKLLTRVLGYTFVLKLVAAEEKAAIDGYEQLKQAIPETENIQRMEKRHEDELIAMLDEERLKYVGAMVLGLNDALVELTGTIAGLSFALQDTRVVALSGIITGVSATLSMAASNYLAERADGNENALKSSLYTGIAYLITVALLVLPYLLLPSALWPLALALMIVIVVLVILGFNYYISVAKGLPFRRRFVEMVSISLGVAVIAFLIGLAAKALLGVDVG